MPYTIAPGSFKGTFEELFHTQISKNLLKADSMLACHKLLIQYLGSKNPVFVCRTVGSVKRYDIRQQKPGYKSDYENTYITNKGNVIHFSDCAPSWCVHAVAYHKNYTMNQFEELLRVKLPCQMMHIPKYDDVGNHANRLGWHFAPIFSNKEDSTDWKNWEIQQLSKSFFKNIHPCNYFLFPKNYPNVTKIVSKPEVLQFVKYEYSKIYRDIWSEFCEFVGQDSKVKKPAGSILL